MKIRNITELPHPELISRRTGERFSSSAILTDLLGFQRLFVHHEILAPGRRASSPHSHSLQEEMIFVLSGSPTAHWGNQSYLLKPGDFLGFPPSSKDLHAIENTTSGDVEFLVISSVNLQDQVIVR